MRDFNKFSSILLTIALVTTNAQCQYEQCYDARTEDEVTVFEDVPSQPDSGNATAPTDPILGLLSLVTGVVPPAGVDPLEVFRDDYPLPKGYSQPLDEYDFIIVGAGSAGSALASRLSEDKQAMVLLLETGKPECLPTDIPVLAAQWPTSDYAFQYQAEPQAGVCSGMFQEGFSTEVVTTHAASRSKRGKSRGKAVGGTGVINFLIYTRGRPQDWDRIAADGNYGWSYDDVLHYYMKAEKTDLKRLPKNPPYHGRYGPLNIEHAPFRTGLAEAFLEAGREQGIPTVDYNSPDEFGFGYVQTTTHYGHRVTPAKAYLHPHKLRRNLHILPSATVTKVNIDPEAKKAYGVEYTRNGTNYTVRARKEVILSAGPITSPQLLMLSGVGPKNHLESLGIPVIKDLPVGRLMYDHVCFPGVNFKLNTTNASILLQKVVSPQNLIKFLTYGDGPFSSTGAVEGIGYVKTSQSEDPEQVPDIELIALGGSLALDNGLYLRRAWRISDKTFEEGFSPLENQDAFMTIPMLLQPKSKGYLELRDTNPLSFPKIYGNYLTDPHDLATLREAVKFIIRLGATKAYQKYGAELHLGEYSQCKADVPGSDAYWDCAIRTLLLSLHHQIATCKMGPASDPEAVVDPELRVYGIEGLRVVDSSVIPRPTSAHTNAPAIMIGEKAADMIKKTLSSDC